MGPFFPWRVSRKGDRCKDREALNYVQVLYARGQFTPPDGYEADQMSQALQERVDDAHRQGTLRKD